MQLVFKQRLCKHVPAETKHARNNRRTAFSVWSLRRSYLEDNVTTSSHVEAGSNIFTAALRVVGGDKKK
jgi:hypothetical protein